MKIKGVNEMGQYYNPVIIDEEDNGQGGGDFGGNDPNNLVGSWARDLISVATRKPSKDFKEVLFTLIEED